MANRFFDKVKTSFSSITGERVLYYPGCMTKYYLPELFNNYKSLLSDIGIDFSVMNDLDCCGSPLLNAGYAADFKELRDKNVKLLRKKGITRIITNCPHCFDIFRNKYDLKGVSVEHITQTLEANKRKLIADNNEEVAYHDPCILARKNHVFKEPRTVLKHTGFTLTEPQKNKEKTFCCGAGGGVKQNSPKIANKIAKERLSKLGSNKIIVSCPYCYAHFCENASKNKKIVELSETLVEE